MIFEKLLELPGDARPWIVDHEPVAVAAPDGLLHPADLGRAAARVATHLASTGVGRGDRCVVWLDSPTDVIVAHVALMALDAVPVLASPTLSAQVVRAMITGVPGVVAIIGDEQRLTAGNGHFGDLVALDWRQVAEAAAGCAPHRRSRPTSPEAPYAVFHTSGTTGVPKLVEYAARGIEFHADVQARIHRLARLKGYCALALSPVHSRTVVAILVALKRNAPLMLLKGDSADEVERLLNRHRPVYFETHPNTYRAWQHLAPRGAFASVRFFAAGFDVIHPDTVDAMLRGSRRRLPMFVEVYGQSETGAIAIRTHARRPSWLPARRAGKPRNGHPVGPRFPFCGVRIIDEEGYDLPHGTPGRIVVRTPGGHSGYLNRPEIKYLQGGWWDTGDWGSLSRTGFLTLVDRRVDKITAAASGIAIEDALLERSPELLELVVLEVGGALQPIASIRPDNRFRAREWGELTRGIAALRRPIIIPDARFPRTATGKVKRVELRELLAEPGRLTFSDNETYYAAGS
ncbi:class I adenylate-forming enzyme family protein [Saccharothrix syringae]|uniref:Long-chain fatty acid--CoA ligase n=1 Tax=Saccharothrix syringae TaxID=103733 RepID=A0A5Q0H4E2_SACSY|nr:class I adenylate-forming enzyme family protein [Saccharothrix syringae]QFZ20670.1 long-chain fatty acid--CoA ligase [Saccharothrix syringae]